MGRAEVTVRLTRTVPAPWSAATTTASSLSDTWEVSGTPQTTAVRGNVGQTDNVSMEK